MKQGAMVKGITWLSYTMKGRERWLIIILTTILSFFAASYGMAEEALVFYPILVPLFLAAGYDLLVPLAIIFGGTSLGCIAAFSNPFSTIIASNAAGINWMDGLGFPANTLGNYYRPVDMVYIKVCSQSKKRSISITGFKI
jgi:uncharacterized ion transporter superfamily protein YfcC